MQISTALKMAQLIEKRGKTTAQELAREFDISVRSVYRYINELSLLLPIYTVQGPGGASTG